MRGILFVIGLACCALLHAQETLGLVPAPVELKLSDGVCQLGRPWKVAEGHAAITAILGPELAALRSGKAPMNSSEPLSISMDLIAFDTIMPPGYYALGVSPDGISISAPDEEGLFLGTRTLIQLIEKYGDKGAIPCLSINDHPRFTWRGMHLDVSRHFFPVDFIKQYIDLLARYKFNTFHWHLTDDQGWRIEIKKYPKLTSVGAWRNGSQVGPYGRREYDTLRYGGFYTQEQIRDVVAYATARHINVVPEIEMPGHALAALAAYPEYSCTGGPFEVNKGWGVFPDVFCTKDSTFTFLEGILDEVLDLFPSRYIHVGGDECPHERWEACPRCQAVMQREGLKNSGELQSYFVRRIERYLNGKGRQLIGWDEILEGGLAPNAAVMSWRGTEGGIEAAKGGHPVVMTPGEFCYFDHYQGDPANEPLAIGGFTPLQKVYRFDPTAGMPDSVARFVLGGQANLWTEYILTPQQVEYMALPRMLALAEVLWTPKEKLDEKDFIRRVEGQFPQLDRSGVNASRSLYEVQFKLSPGSAPGKIKIELVPGLPGEMGYVQDQTEAVIKYTGPFEIDRSSLIKAGLYDEQGKSPRSTARTFVFNKATARKITLSTPPDERYDDGGAFTLVDGISGGERRVNTEWLGWRKSVTITVDLDSVQALTHVGIGSWHETYAWIHQPTNVVVSTSVDGKTFTPLVTIPAPADANGRTVYSADKVATARYVRFTVQHAGDIPEGFPGAGKPGWLFLDEIDVR